MIPNFLHCEILSFITKSLYIFYSIPMSEDLYFVVIMEFFFDSWKDCFVVADILSVASFYSSPASSTVCTSISLQCYTGAYATLRAIAAEDLPPPLCSLPSCWTPPHGPGLLVDVTGVMRWQPLAKWTLKLLTRCVSESALLVEGLLTTSFLTAVGALLSYGDGHLQKVGIFS